MPFSHIDQIHSYENYKNGLRADLSKVSGVEVNYHYFASFPFSNKKGPLLLVGEVKAAILAEVKKQATGYVTGKCHLNDKKELTFSGTVDTTKVETVLKEAQVQSTVNHAPPAGHAARPLAAPESKPGESARLAKQIAERRSDLEAAAAGLEAQVKSVKRPEAQAALRAEALKKQEAQSAEIDKLEQQLAVALGKVPTTTAKTNRPLRADEPLDRENLLTKDKGSEFADEDKMKSFRAADPAQKTDPKYTTEYHQDPKPSAVQIEGGVLKDAQGTPLDGTFGFVVDPKTGKLHTFTGKAVVFNLTGDALRLWGGEEITDYERMVATHHTSPLAGGAAAGAGEIVVAKGKLVKIIDKSGHYKPEGPLTHQAVKLLKEEGVPLIDPATGKSVVDVALGGKGLTEEEFAQVKGDRVKINDLLLKKHGVAGVLPLGIEAAVLNNLAQLNNAIRETYSQPQTMGAEQFLQTGGGEKAMRQKAAVTWDLQRLVLSEKQFNKVKGDRDKINRLIRELVGVKDAVPEGTPAKVLNSRAQINALIAKNAPPPPEAEGTRLVPDPDDPSGQAKVSLADLARRRNKTIDEVTEELASPKPKATTRNFGMTATWGSSSLGKNCDELIELGKHCNKEDEVTYALRDDWGGEDEAVNVTAKDLAGVLGIKLEELYELITGEKA